MNRYLLTLALVMLTIGPLSGAQQGPDVAAINLDAQVAANENLTQGKDGTVTWWLPQGKGDSLLIDLAAQNIDPTGYDEIRFDFQPLVGTAYMNWVLHGHLQETEISSWYLKFQTPMNEWTEGRFSLHTDDDGAYLSRGKNPQDLAKWLKIDFGKRVLGYPGEPKDRRIMLRNIRLVRNPVTANFALGETELINDDGEIAYVYSLHLKNQTDADVEVALALDEEQRLHYFTATAPSTVKLAAGEAKTIPVRIFMSRHQAMAMPPLYSEAVLPRIRVLGKADSDVVPLMGYRRWPMWGTVPVFNDRPWQPVEFQAHLAAREKAMPGIAKWREKVISRADSSMKHDWPIPDFGPPVSTLEYRCRECKVWMKPVSATALREHTCPKCNKVVTDDERLDQSYLPRYYGSRGQDVEALSLAWLMTGNDAYAEKAKAMLLDFAVAYPTMPILGARSTATCAKLGMTTLHASYSIPSFAHGYFYLRSAPCMDADSLRQIRQFVVDTGITVSRHSVEYGNQQSEHIKAYGTVGLATGFWPLVGEAIYGEFGYHEVVEYGFTEDGIAQEAGAYHRASFGALNGLAEFAWESGVNLYTPRFKRVFDGTQQAGLGGTSYELAYKVYRDPAYIGTLAARDSGHIGRTAALDGVLGLPDTTQMPIRSSHLTGAGYIFLRQGTAAGNRQIHINYGSQFDRGERDRLTTFFFDNGRQIDSSVGRMGYAVQQAEWMTATAAHNCIVIDGKDEDSSSGRLIAFEESADTPVAVIGTDAERPLYAGVEQMRCVALLGDQYVVFDLVRADQPRIIDRYQYGKGAPELLLDGVAPIEGEFAALPDGGTFHSIQGADAGKQLRIDFRDGMKMRLLSDGDMMSYRAITRGGYQGQPMHVTFARRPATQAATFLAAFSFGKDSEPGSLEILSSDWDAPAFAVTDGDVTYRVQIDPRQGTVKVVTQ